MTPEQATKLREPFAPESVGKLPRVFCRECREAPGKVCRSHRKVKCQVCRNNITDAHLHLDYVGHAEITDRLLMVDSDWTWEPVAFGAEGLPLLDREGGLWIRLTVAGVTRLGYGDSEGKRGPSAIKEAIGDALRNAAMRFGVGLDLWGATYKGADPDPHEADPTESEQVDVFESFLLEVRNAKTPEDLDATAHAANRSMKAKTINKIQFEHLAKEAAAKRAEFAQQGDQRQLEEALAP